MGNDKSKWADALIISAMTAIGLFIAIILYPFLHESGHSLAAFVVGADVIEFRVLPVPYVMCNVASLTEIQQMIIGVSGMALPVIIALVIPKRWFWTWYIRFVLLGISLLAFTISVVTLLLPNGAAINPQDDMLQVLNLWLGSKNSLLFMVCAIGISILLRIVFDKPIKRFCMKFGI